MLCPHPRWRCRPHALQSADAEPWRLRLSRRTITRYELELIAKSYKRLALRLHPDRNPTAGATAAFQLLGRAYQTLKDQSTRRAYDLIYPSIQRSAPCPGTTQTPRPSPTSAPPQSEALSEATQIAALYRSKQERAARWQTKKTACDSAIFELRRSIRQLEQKIKDLESIAAAEAAVEAQKNSWGTWIVSPLYKKVEDTEDEKARKDRERQERKIERDLKERLVIAKKMDLKVEEILLRTSKEDVSAADRSEDYKIRVIEARRTARETREREAKEKAERERLAKILRQAQEQRAERERAEYERAMKMWKEEQERARAATRHVYTSSCAHKGWWPKVKGRASCPECDES
ncbi:hypothetical protein LTR48_006996 [Friedmanniomyces endolithicus]|nr:hypothetical protein LTR48_006996 [Friedmanniomyces endolithicus]